MGKQAQLVLLIVTIALVQASGGSESEALFVHVVRNVCFVCCLIFGAAKSEAAYYQL